MSVADPRPRHRTQGLCPRGTSAHVQAAGYEHGRMLRPPVFLAEACRLMKSDESSIKDIPGARVIWEKRRAFFAVVADKE